MKHLKGASYESKVHLGEDGQLAGEEGVDCVHSRVCQAGTMLAKRVAHVRYRQAGEVLGGHAACTIRCGKFTLVLTGFSDP